MGDCEGGRGAGAGGGGGKGGNEREGGMQVPLPGLGRELRLLPKLRWADFLAVVEG